jgi:hypothetical protein
MRAGLVQLTVTDDPAVNLPETIALVRAAVAGGAEFVLTPECTNGLSSNRVHQQAIFHPEASDPTLAALVDHAFEDRGLHRVAANIIPHNNRSIALVRALGFTREGVLRGLIEIDGAWRDHECWSVLSTEWREGTLDRSRDAEAKRRTSGTASGAAPSTSRASNAPRARTPRG